MGGARGDGARSGSHALRGADPTSAGDLGRGRADRAGGARCGGRVRGVEPGHGPRFGLGGPRGGTLRRFRRCGGGGGPGGAAGRARSGGGRGLLPGNGRGRGRPRRCVSGADGSVVGPGAGGGRGGAAGGVAAGGSPGAPGAAGRLLPDGRGCVRPGGSGRSVASLRVGGGVAPRRVARAVVLPGAAPGRGRGGLGGDAEGGSRLLRREGGASGRDPRVRAEACGTGGAVRAGAGRLAVRDGMAAGGWAGRSGGARPGGVAGGRGCGRRGGGEGGAGCVRAVGRRGFRRGVGSGAAGSGPGGVPRPGRRGPGGVGCVLRPAGR